jgi:hypothetical protein
LSNEEKTNDYENFEKGMIYMKILKKGGVVEKRGEEETKSMPHGPVEKIIKQPVVTQEDTFSQLVTAGVQISGRPVAHGNQNVTWAT